MSDYNAWISKLQGSGAKAHRPTKTERRRDALSPTERRAIEEAKANGIVRDREVRNLPQRYRHLVETGEATLEDALRWTRGESFDE